MYQTSQVHTTKHASSGHTANQSEVLALEAHLVRCTHSLFYTGLPQALGYRICDGWDEKVAKMKYFLTYPIVAHKPK